MGAERACLQPSLAAGNSAVEIEKGLRQASLDVLATVARDPGSLNMPYLRQRLGPAANERHQANLTRRTYYWYDQNRHLRYELLEQPQAPGFVSDAMLIVHFPGDGLEFAQVEKLYGKQGKPFFDNCGHPGMAYTLVPGCRLTFIGAPQAAYAAHSAAVIYKGPPILASQALYAPVLAPPATPLPSHLPPVPAQTVPVAPVAAGLGLPPHASNPQPEPSLAVLQEAVRLRPLDYQAHLALAAAFKALHQDDLAAQEYKLGVSLAPRSENGQKRSQLASTKMKSH